MTVIKCKGIFITEEMADMFSVYSFYKEFIFIWILLIVSVLIQFNDGQIKFDKSKQRNKFMILCHKTCI